MDGKSLSALRFPYKSDRLKPLRAFCQTARLGSVSRAAEALYVSQPAISLQLQALERELGVALLERSGRRLVPTREGHVLYELAVPLVEALQSMGATPWQIIRTVMIPEAMPGIVAGLTITLVSLIGHSAMAGAVGGGGLGDLGIRYGYQRFPPEVMALVVLVLIVLVQFIQSAGDRLARRIGHR